MTPPQTQKNPYTSVGGSIPSQATSSQGKNSRDTPGQTTPEPWGFTLWQHLHQEHGLTLVESELQEIVRLAEPLTDLRADNEELLTRFRDRVESHKHQVAMAFSNYVEASEITRLLLNDVKTALAGGLAHQRSRLELAVARHLAKFKKLTFDAPPSIKTDVRLFDLVRYMRAELHRADLITDEEYAWLCSTNPGEQTEDGSPSRERLETYDEIRAELSKWQTLAGTLAKSIGGLSPIYGLTPAQDQALAAYEAAKKGAPGA